MAQGRAKRFLVEHGYQLDTDVQGQWKGDFRLIGKVTEEDRLFVSVLESRKARVTGSTLEELPAKAQAEYVLVDSGGPQLAIFRRDPLLGSYRPTLFLMRSNGTFWGEHSRGELVIPSNLGPIISESVEMLRGSGDDAGAAELLANTLVLKMVDETGHDQELLFRLSPQDVDSPKRMSIIQQRLSELAGYIPKMDVDASIEELVHSPVVAQIMILLQRFNLTAAVREGRDLFCHLSSAWVHAGKRGLSGVPCQVAAAANTLMPAELEGHWLLRTGSVDGLFDLVLSHPSQPWVFARLNGGTVRLVRWLCPEAQFAGTDLLEQDTDEELPLFRLVVLNPTFSKSIGDRRLLSQFELAERGPGQRLRTREASVLYLEQAFRLLEPGGWLIALLPDGVLNNVGFRSVREWMEERFRICSVVSLPAKAFLEVGTGVKASLVCLQKWSNTPVDDYPIFMAELEGDDAGQILPAELDSLATAYRRFCEGFHA